MPQQKASTRTFTAPAGTVIDGFTLPRAVSYTLEYSKSEMTPSQAQKRARARVSEMIANQFGVKAPVTKLQKSTAVVNKPTGKARGGRIPDVQKVLGFRKKPGWGKRANDPGITTYTKGSEKGRAIGNSFEHMDAMVRQAFSNHPRARVSVSAFGFADERSKQLQSPKRRKKDHPLGLWKKGDVIPHARQWGSTAQIASLQEWERLYGTPDKFAFGPDGAPDTRNRHSGTELDANRLYRIDVLVRES